jgi:hypothetical protein
LGQEEFFNSSLYLTLFSLSLKKERDVTLSYTGIFTASSLLSFFKERGWG